MKRVNLKNSLMIAIMAIGMVMVFCGGGSGKQQSTATGEPSAASIEKVNISDHYKAVAKPNIAYIEDWMIPADGILAYVNEEIKGVQTRMSVGGMTWAQYESYMKTLEKYGMKKNLNSSVGDVNNFENASVRITLDHDDGIKLGDNLKNSWLGIYIEKK